MLLPYQKTVFRDHSIFDSGGGAVWLHLKLEANQKRAEAGGDRGGPAGGRRVRYVHVGTSTPI